MGSLNIAEWSPDQVAEWLSGLGPTVAGYVPALRQRGLNGSKLLTLRCDDLEYLGIHIIGHQELLLEAVEHLRNFQYELSRECVQQLALRVSGAATSLARALRNHADARLETHSLADVAATVRAVKPLVCWLDRRVLCCLLPCIVCRVCTSNDVSDPTILQPASLDTVTLRQGSRPLGFEVLPSFCGHHQLAHIRFGSPAHASGAVHDADEIVQVGGQCVIGWGGEAVERLCARVAAAAPSGELTLRLRRRGAALRPARTPPLHAPARARAAARRAPPLAADLRLHRYEVNVPRMVIDDRSEKEKELQVEAEAGAAAAVSAQAEAEAEAEASASSSDDSEPLSPPASPTHLHLDSVRLFPVRAGRGGGIGSGVRGARRHSVCGGSPRAQRHHLPLDQFWQQLQHQRWTRGAHEDCDAALYRRDKAVSCSTGLELSPRPRTCLGVAPVAPPVSPPAPLAATPAAMTVTPAPPGRGRLDKSHSTPAYDFLPGAEERGLASQAIPESPGSPTDSPRVPPALPALPAALADVGKAGQILDFKKSSCQIGEAILQQRTRRLTADDKEDKLEEDLDDDPKLDLVDTVNSVVVAGRNEELVKQMGANESLKLLINVKMDESIVDDSSPVNNRGMITSRERETPPEPPPRPRALAAPPAPPAATPSAPPVPPARPPRDSHFVSPPRDLPLVHYASEDNLILTTLATIVCNSDLLFCAGGISPSAPTPTSIPRISRDPQSARHIAKHDIRLVSSERRALPPINGDENALVPLHATPNAPPHASPHAALPHCAHDPAKGLFPSSKTRSLKKKNSILAKRREVPARTAAARGAAGGDVWQRVRGSAAQQPRWARRHLLLAHSLLYAYRSPDCARADCMVYLEGFTVSAAGEVKSRAHAFKVYHTGTAFYFAADSRDAMLAWIQLIHRATLLPSLLPASMELFKQFSETDYSETESDCESPEKPSEPRERDKEKEKEKDKDKSKFGSLKKLTHRMQRSESQENVSHSSTSLDRKYLRFFSRNKTKDEPKPNKASPSRAPAEHPRSTAAVKKIPKPINYIHASNPNLLDFEKSDFVTKPAIQVPKRQVQKPDSLVGLVTLEQFMLQRQAEERHQRYSGRVHLGLERDRVRSDQQARQEQQEQQELQQLQAQLQRVVPDVVYGELREPARHAHGYEKIVYPESRGDTWRDSLRRNDKVHSGAKHAPDSWGAGGGSSAVGVASAGKPDNGASGGAASGADSGAGSGTVSAVGGGAGNGVSSGVVSGPGVSRLRLMFGGARQESGRGAYPHLQCPPTFQPETYSLAHAAARRTPHAQVQSPTSRLNEQRKRAPLDL
ncbi:unnamed protein product [Parnassius apollo]|uniref:(apollo) hypothetical protein n=1 Tax=Parnassius apollo TaxID=110799 RepID=A0A8S3XI49_PARAO|nr:unnamed protein product [Parnassius apollo]